LGSIASQSAAVARVHWWIGNTESCANLREEGQGVARARKEGWATKARSHWELLRDLVCFG